MRVKKHYFLMISCPGDVVNERKLLKDCVEAINSERSDDVWVELQYWMTDTSSDAGMQAQDSINEQIVNDCDGLIAIFNARLGTPVHNYKCGTDEEIDLMLKAKKHVSLLFNTKPIIDLSNPSSIDQITKLQEYKNEQSKKAYYREFSDENSFMILVRREILLWLRGLIKKESTKADTHINSETIITLEDDGTTEHLETPTDSKDVKETNKTIKKENSVCIDKDAGAFDCVYSIINAAEEITNEINNFNDYCNKLSENTNTFNDRFNLLKKQKQGNSGALIACQKFAGEINEHNDLVDAVVKNIEFKWNEIYQYLLILNQNEDISTEDKIIINDSVITVKASFEESIPHIDEFLETMTSIPNFQKDIKNAINTTAKIYRHLKIIMIRIVDNCEEIASLKLQECGDDNYA